MVKNSFSFKIICVVCILLILAGHNLIVYVHEKDAQIDQMQAEIEMLLSGDSGGAGASSGEAASDGASGSAGAYKDGTYSGSADGAGYSFKGERIKLSKKDSLWLPLEQTNIAF